MSSTWLTQGIVSLWIEAPGIARSVKPGQFLGVRPGPGPDPLLRRPISVADVSGNRLRLVFRVVGRGTELASRVKPGDKLDVLGPLGRPAPMPSEQTNHKDTKTQRGQIRRPQVGGQQSGMCEPLSAHTRVIVCGGGVGAAPLLFFMRRFRERGDARVFLGARTRKQLILVKEFRSLGVPVKLATDDGTAGFHGMVTELVENEVRKQAQDRLSAVSCKPSAVFACGPRPMLAELVRRLDPIPVWGFVEERMGCGTGICYCCALPRRGGGYIRFCEEGPVVLLNEVKL